MAARRITAVSYTHLSWDTVACIPAVSSDRQFVIDLIGQCARGQLSPVHLFDVVLDALP